MYFGLGIILLLFFYSMSWKLKRVIAVGTVVGFIDEFVKVFLPTREFDFFDLIRDFIGIVMAYCLFSLFSACVVANRE